MMALAQRIGRALARRETSLAFQSIVLTSARAAGMVITFAIPLVLVRTFDQTQFGLYKQLFLIAGTAIPILNLGLYASIFYFMPRDEADGQRYALQAIGVLTFTGAIAALALLLGRNVIVGFFEAPALGRLVPLLALYVLLSTPTELFASIAIVDRRTTLAAYLMAGGDVIRAAMVIGAAVIGRSLDAVVWATIAVALLRGAWLMLYLQYRRPANPRPVSRSDLVEQLRYSLPFALSVLFGIGLARFHEYYVSANTTTALFAVYSIGIVQLPVLGLLVQSVAEVIQIRAAQAHKAGDQQTLRQLWHGALQRLAVVIIPCWAAAEIISRDLIVLLFGTPYIAAVPVFRLTICTVILWVAVDHGVLRAMGETPFLVRTNAIALFVTVVSVLLLARYSIMLGGIGGYVIGVATMRVLGTRQVARRLSLTWRTVMPWRYFARITVAVAASSLAAVGARELVGPTPVVRVVVAAVAFSVVYIFIGLRMDLVPREELEPLLRRFVPMLGS